MTPTAVEVLSPEEILALDRTSKEILQDTGIGLRSQELLYLLEGKGLEVDHEGERVRFSPEQVQRGIALTPPSLEIFDRDKFKRFTLGRGCPPRFAAGFNATFTLETTIGARRPATKADVARYARVAQHLEELDMVGPSAVPHDVAAPAALLHAVEAVLDNTTKPILFAPENDEETAALIEILKVVAGEANIGAAPQGICQFSPSSPLFWNEGTLKGFLRMVGEGFPCTILPGPLAGATSPYTLAANLVQKNCEVLAAVVMAQFVRPGAPLLCYNAGGQFDMRAQTAVFGSPEVALILMAGTQLARFYGLPTHGCFPSSDSHCLDEQIGIENTMQLLVCLLSGADLMVNAGMFAGGETVSLEQLVIDNDLCGLVRRIARGMKVDEQHLCREAFGRVGPRGNYLEDPTTLAHLRNGEWSEAKVLCRQRHEQWRGDGAPDIVERARRVAEELGRREQAPLKNEQKRRIRSIITDYERSRVSG